MTSPHHPTPMARRRLFKAGLAVTTAAVAAGAVSAPAASAALGGERSGTEAELTELERRHGARLGVYARNVRTGRTVSHRAGERFAMCSTFKAFAAAAVLRDHGDCAPLDAVIHYPPHDLLPPLAAHRGARGHRHDGGGPVRGGHPVQRQRGG